MAGQCPISSGMSFTGYSIAFPANVLTLIHVNFALSKNLNTINHEKKHSIHLLAFSLLFLAACSTGLQTPENVQGNGFLESTITKHLIFNTTVPEGADPLTARYADSKQLATRTITGSMASKGLVRSGNPELMVNLSVLVKEKTQTRQTDFRTDGLPRYMGQRRYSWKSEEVEIGKYQEGTLILDIIDTKNDKLVWRSGIKGVLPENTGKAEAGLTVAIHDLMGKLQ